MDSTTLAAIRASASSSGFLMLSNPNHFSSSLSWSCRDKRRVSFFFRSIKGLIPNPNPNNPRHSFSLKSNTRNSSVLRTAATEAPFGTTTELAIHKLKLLVSEFESLTEPTHRVKRLLHFANMLPPFDESKRVTSNRVMGCTAQVWLDASMDEFGKMRFFADSDSEIAKVFCSCLLWILDGALPEEVLELKTDDLGALNVGLPGRVHSRMNSWHNVLISMQKRTKALLVVKERKPPVDLFPSLLITADVITAKGSYAEAQANFLFPDDLKVKELVTVLREKKIGVGAHFYMDPEVQGVLTAAQKQWPHIYISDSLVMADTAVKMAEAGCQFITVLGVDFMSENVRAILDQAGFEKVDVYRMSSDCIGCSLVDAAASPTYMGYLEEASRAILSLHVIYINTSLETKAYAHELVPTITCTSSNVVQTILQAFAQILDLNIWWYGPDSYMGANIAELFQQMANMSDEEIAEIHPEHGSSLEFLLSVRCILICHQFGVLIGVQVVSLEFLLSDQMHFQLLSGAVRCYSYSMNSLSSLLSVRHQLPDNKFSLTAYEVGRFNSQTRLGKSVADVGCEPILHKRHFQATKTLPEKLVNQILHTSDNGR